MVIESNDDLEIPLEETFCLVFPLNPRTPHLYIPDLGKMRVL